MVAIFLNNNTDLNGDPDIPFVRTDRADANSDLGEYELIIGSGVLYERDHATQLADFIDRHAKIHTDVIIVDPGRRQQGRFRTRMSGRGYVYNEIESGVPDNTGMAFKGRFMRYQKIQ